MKKAPGQLGRTVEEVIARSPVDDIHTHLYDPAFGDLLLWGIDDLLVYHYLVAEGFRYLAISYDDFWSLTKQQQADIIWEKLFQKHSPISESCRGVLTTLHKLGIDPRKRDLPSLRKWFGEWTVADYTTRCMELGNVQSICMTNSPFDDLERPVWEGSFKRDSRFKAALRIDPLLTAWDQTGPRLIDWGYKVKPDLGIKTISEVQRFLSDWTRRMNPEFLMVSLAPDFSFPDGGPCAQLIEKAILPHCREFDLPFAVMPGVRRAVNPSLKLAGDGVGPSDLVSLQNLIAAHPKNKFLCTILSREDQHELCVLARKFRNLHVFGCWWFTNIPSVIEEITRMRLELLGLSFTAQHSDARVLDQIIYKWHHSREIISRVLVEKYEALSTAGWEPTTAEIERDIRLLFGGSYREFRALTL
ncbi:MAG TPA: glucuronate isomerase [Candidatus Kapabacteria bacterium]|nr:glucuronate isomerase [Candidatus Kapabacteria bacterium]